MSNDVAGENQRLLGDKQKDRGEKLKKVWTSGDTGRFQFTGQTRNIVLAVLNVLSNVMMNVSLPIYAGTMNESGGDTFVLLINTCFIISIMFVLTTLFAKKFIDPTVTFKPTSKQKIYAMMGLFTALNGIFVVYASPLNRTPGYLQGILSSTTIPFTVLCRLIFLRKGISVAKSICTCVVLVGLFITIEPQIWGIDADADANAAHESAAARILWPLCFAFGFLPIGIMNVICEKELKKEEGQSFGFIMWGQFYQLGWMFLLFWTDFIPGFGEVNSASAFFSSLRRGLTCSYSNVSGCQDLIGKSWIFFVGYTFGNLFQYLLIQYAEGAVYAVVVQAMIAPLVTVFWAVFQYENESGVFRWHPTFNTTTGFTIAGLCIIIPGVVLYNYFSSKETKETTDKELQITINESA
ncbi:hypothetical protein FSP39_010283 [Pinctada imbricata]|uniref:Uncharacterized protein n=1 Tax=Pinctada imbricata TaxID=66713 RepID=A0AA88YPI7_PINIB|nr:hypothetical protein FSP39_010283 [Pinctada imbricata]